MNRRGHRGRTDSNHTSVVDALRAVGVRVQSLASVGDGCPDLLCLYRGRLVLMEVKRENGSLTGPQQQWLADGWPVAIVRSAEDAIQAVVR